MHGSFLKHLFYDFLALLALGVIVFSLQDAFKISTPPYIVLLLSWILCFLEYWIFEKTSPKFRNRFLNFLMVFFIIGFLEAFLLFFGAISGTNLDMDFDVLGYSCSWTFFCAFYTFLIVALKVRNAEKHNETLVAKKQKKLLRKKTETENSIIGWKIIAFIFTCIPYCILYALQGFMSHSPQFWPLPIVLILSGCVFFMSGKRKYLSFSALCLFSIAIDLSGMTGACSGDIYEYCYGHTYVFSPLLIIFWGLYLAPGTIRSIADKIKSKKAKY